MTVHDVQNALGSWSLNLADIPPETWDRLGYLGHVAVVRGRLAPPDITDALLTPGVAAYVGVLRERKAGTGYTIGGPNLAFWLGDEDGKGSVYETPVELADATFPDAVRALLPASGAVTEGTLYPVTGRTYTGRHVYESPRSALTYLCQTVSTDAHPCSWRVNPDGSLDAGRDEDLFVTDPKCIIVRKGAGEDLRLRARSGAMDVDSDLEDFTTRVVLLAEGEGDSIATGAADIDPDANPYVDLHGNPARLTRLVSESDTTTGNADVRAQLQLNRFSGPRRALTLTAEDYDVQGDYAPGDYVYVYDPDSGLVDTAIEVVFRGMRVNPIKLKVTEVGWPVTAGYTVAYRAGDGTWTDLTDYVAWDAPGNVRIVVGDFTRSLTSAGTEPVGSRPNQDTSVPGIPVLVEPFQGAAYLDGKGFTRARVVISWEAPHNTDGSTVRDGAYYELRYAVDTDSIYPSTWSALSQIRWRDAQTWAQPFAAPDGTWQVLRVAWDTTNVQLQDLSPGVGYDVQIRAVDTSENLGQWSSTVTFVATQDNIPPSTPAPPAVASSRIALQITHELGKASGGTFNLERDLDHLEIHAQYEPTFPPSDSTLLGKLKANASMIQAGIPAVGTYQVESTDDLYVKVVAVDISGNRSGPSDPVQSTALLIDDAHISDLTVSKVTAGTITASWVMAGEIKTADSGARARVSADGFETYNDAGTRTFFADAATGDVSMIGELRSTLTNGAAVVVNPSDDYPQIRFYSPDGTKYAWIFGVDEPGTGSDASIKLRSSDGADGSYGYVSVAETFMTAGMGKGDAEDIIREAGGVSFYSHDQASVAFRPFGESEDSSGIYLTDTLMQLGWMPGQSNERTIYADSSGLAMFGTLRAQSQANQIQHVRAASAAANVATLSIAYAVTYAALPYTVATLNQTPVSAWCMTATSTSGCTLSRATTTNGATAHFIITKGP